MALVKFLNHFIYSSQLATSVVIQEGANSGRNMGQKLVGHFFEDRTLIIL